ATVPPLTRSEILGQLLYQVIVSVPMSAFFAAAAAWYRRFLRRASPNRQAQQSAARRPDGKVPKKNEQRPMLARRRWPWLSRIRTPSLRCDLRAALTDVRVRSRSCSVAPGADARLRDERSRASGSQARRRIPA